MREQSSTSHVDSCWHIQLADETSLHPFLEGGWKDWVGKPDTMPGGRGMRPVKLNKAWPDPSATDSLARLGAAGTKSDRADDPLRIAFCEDTHATAASTNPLLATAVTQAANRWIQHTIHEVQQHALVQVPNQSADDAVREIAAYASDDRFVGVSLGANGIGKPFGHPEFHAIYRAACEADMPVVLHAGSEGYPDAPASAAAGGNCATHTEYAMNAALGLQGHLYSMITMGVFERFPGLKVVAQGCGYAWISTFLWRLDATYRGLRKEVPWIKQFPSDYLRRHVWIGTSDCLGIAIPSSMIYLEQVDWPLDHLLYASGHRGGSRVPACPQDFAESAWQGVLAENARAVYRL